MFHLLFYAEASQLARHDTMRCLNSLSDDGLGSVVLG